MQSIRIRFNIGLIRNRHFFLLKFKRPVIDHTFSVDEFRARTEKASGILNKRFPEANRTTVDINGIYGEWIDIEGTSEN